MTNASYSRLSIADPGSQSNSRRDPRLDYFKAFAIVAIMLWHFKLIPTWSFVWAIPTFVFVTAASYSGRTKSISLHKILANLAWVFGIAIVVTLILHLAMPLAETLESWLATSLIKWA